MPTPMRMRATKEAEDSFKKRTLHKKLGSKKFLEVVEFLKHCWLKGDKDTHQLAELLEKDYRHDEFWDTKTPK